MTGLNITDWVGSAAATLTTIAFVPQAIHSYRTRDLSGISLPMYTAFTIGVALWLTYGLLNNDWPIIVANAITLVLCVAIWILKVRERN